MGKEFQEWFLSYRPADIKVAKVKTTNYGKLKHKYVKTLRQQHKKNGKTRKNKKRPLKKRGFFFQMCGFNASSTKNNIEKKGVQYRV